MASVITRYGFTSFINATTFLPPFSTVIRESSFVVAEKPKKGTIKHRNLIAADCESLANRGFLRNKKPYTPEPDAAQRVQKICESYLKDGGKLTDKLSLVVKFFILEKCFTEFKHGVPNSMLSTITTASDIIDFYTTPVSTTVPFDEMKNQNLPPNLHIMYDYERFDPATDNKFGGISAYPECPSVVTGLRYKEKYTIKQSERLPEYYYNEAIYMKK